MLVFLKIISYGLIIASSGLTLAVVFYYFFRRLTGARGKTAPSGELPSVSIINVAGEERRWTEDSIRTMFVTLYKGNVEVIFSTKDMDSPYVSTAMSVSMKFPQTGMVLNEFHPPQHQFEKASLEVSGAKVAQNSVLVFVDPDVVLDSSLIEEMVYALGRGNQIAVVPAGFRPSNYPLSSALCFLMNSTTLNPKFSFYMTLGASLSNKIVAVPKDLYNETIARNPDALNRYSSLEALARREGNPIRTILLEKGAIKFVEARALKDLFQSLKFETLNAAGGRKFYSLLALLAVCGIPASLFAAVFLKIPIAVLLLPFAAKTAALSTPLYNSMRGGARTAGLILSPLTDTLIFLVSICSFIKPSFEIGGRRYRIRNSLLFPE
ncbi:MAG: hypothetical protein FJ088_01430 [Deltaproteobacteria bacterium]|nr:hypothetical protein [Deltaproteobacteria bacterium]